MTLEQARKKYLRLTQKEMADKIGVSLKTYWRYEKHGAPEPVMRLIEMMLTRHATPAHQAR